VIDTRTGKVTASYPLSYSVTAMTTSRDGKRIYAGRAADGAVDVAIIDVITQRVSTIYLAKGDDVVIDAMRVDSSDRRLYVATSDSRGSRLIVVDLENGRVRRTLEVGAARLAARRRTAKDCQRLRDLISQRDAHWAAGDLDAAAEADVELHLAIARASRNPVLAELYEHLIVAIGENVRFNVAHPLPAADDDHVQLVQAIVDGDPDQAAARAAGFLDELLRSSRASAAES
jgi:DNA-binding FadR family transcriptional regulator